MVSGGAEGLGIRSILMDMGTSMKLKLSEDSTAAKGIADRTGLGKVRHIGVNQLWLQEKVKHKDIEFAKVKGIESLADALTKHSDAEDIRKHINGVFCEIRKGRHKDMPEVADKGGGGCIRGSRRSIRPRRRRTELFTYARRD